MVIQFLIFDFADKIIELINLLDDSFFHDTLLRMINIILS